MFGARFGSPGDDFRQPANGQQQPDPRSSDEGPQLGVQLLGLGSQLGHVAADEYQPASSRRIEVDQDIQRIFIEAGFAL